MLYYSLLLEQCYFSLCQLVRPSWQDHLRYLKIRIKGIIQIYWFLCISTVAFLLFLSPAEDNPAVPSS